MSLVICHPGQVNCGSVSSLRFQPNKSKCLGLESTRGNRLILYLKQTKYIANDILKKISDHIPGMKGKEYYWKYHSGKYAKDGVKASDYSLRLPTQ
jgi:hypothetical protein